MSVFTKGLGRAFAYNFLGYYQEILGLVCLVGLFLSGGSSFQQGAHRHKYKVSLPQV